MHILKKIKNLKSLNLSISLKFFVVDELINKVENCFLIFLLLNIDSLIVDTPCSGGGSGKRKSIFFFHLVMI